MAIKTPVKVFEGRIYDAEGTCLACTLWFNKIENLEELAHTVNLLPQLIAKLKEANSFIRYLSDEEGLTAPDICAEIDSFLAEAKS